MAILIKELILQREEEMMKREFSYSKVKTLKTYWNKFLDYCERKDVIYFEEKYMFDFLKDYSKQNKQRYINAAIKAINVLLDFDSLFDKNIKIKTNDISDSFKMELDSYLCYSRNIKFNSERTIFMKKKETLDFICFLEKNNIYSFNNLNDKIIISFIDNYDNKLRNKRISMCWNLRELLKYLYEENILDKYYAYLIPIIKREKQVKVPTVFEKNDVIKIIEQLKQDKVYTLAGRRNYAMILIAAKTGLRISDIKNLKYENIDWKNNTFNIIQYKTKQSLTIPFTNDIGEAIIDYIKLERPFKMKSKQEEIFLRHKYPYVKLSNNFYLYDVVTTSAEKANVDLSKYNKKGIHSFRFTIATEMLNNEIPINIISSTLGHCNIKTTNNYLKVDIKHLEDCFYEVDDNV